MDDQLKKIQRQNRRMGIFLLILFLLTVFSAYKAWTDNTPPVIQQFVGQDGKNAVVDYEKIYEIIDARIASLTPRDGRDSTVPGPKGADGLNGLNATPEQIAAAVAAYCEAHNNCIGPTGETGEPGQPGREIEFGCNKKRDYQWRYVGDFTWTTIQKNSKACTENIL